MQNVDGYHMIGPVGSGSTSTVWKAHDTQLDRAVALKRLDNSTAELREQWRSEARLLATLREPHIVEVYEYLEDGDAAFIVEEWVEGATLSAVLVKHGKLTTAQGLGVIRGALLGLAHAHDRGVVHRDVSTANILVESSGTSRLIDFGLAAAAGSAANTSGSGTAAYRGPEADTAAPAPTGDVYAAAAVLTHLLTGTAAQPPATDALDPALRAVVRRATAAAPEDRYPDAGAFLLALEEAARNRYGSAWWTEAGMAAFASSAGVAVVATANAARQSRTAPAVALTGAVTLPRRSGMSRRAKLISAGAAGVIAVGGIGAAIAAGGGDERPKAAASSPATAVVAITSTSAPAVATPSATPSASTSPAPAQSSSAAVSASAAPASGSATTASASAASSPKPTRPPGISPAQALAGRYALTAVFTTLDIPLTDDATGQPMRPGFSFPGVWTITATCTAGNRCTGTIVSTSGLRYPLLFASGHWRGSTKSITPCYDGSGRKTAETGSVVISVDIPGSAASLTKPPASLAGTHVRRYAANCGTRAGTATGTIALVRQ